MLYPMNDLSNEVVCTTIDYRNGLRGETSVVRKEQISSARKADKSRASRGTETRAPSRTAGSRPIDQDRKSRSRVVAGGTQLQTSASSGGITPSPFTRPRGSRATPPIPTLTEGHKSQVVGGGSPDTRGLGARDERRSTRASSRSLAREKLEEDYRKHLPFGNPNSFAGSVTTQQISACYAHKVNTLKNAPESTVVSLRRLSKGQQVVSSPGIRGFEDKDDHNSEINKSVNFSREESSKEEDDEPEESNEESSEVGMQQGIKYRSNTLLTLEPSKVTTISSNDTKSKGIASMKQARDLQDPNLLAYPPSPTKVQHSSKPVISKKVNIVSSSGVRPIKQRIEDLRSSNSSKIVLTKQPGETTVEDLLHMRSFSKHGTNRPSAAVPSKGLLPKPSVRDERTYGLIQTKPGISNLHSLSASSGIANQPNTPAEPASHTSSKRGKSPPKKQVPADDYYPVPRTAAPKTQLSTNSKLKDYPGQFGTHATASGEYMSSYIRNRVERMGEGTLLQRELIANKNNSRLDALERKKMCLMQSTKKTGMVMQALVNPHSSHEFSKPSLVAAAVPQPQVNQTAGAVTVASTATSSTNQHNPVQKATSPAPPAAVTPPPAAAVAGPKEKEKEHMKDYKLNNMFKMIDFLEHDQDLTQGKNGFRVGSRS